MSEPEPRSLPEIPAPVPLAFVIGGTAFGLIAYLLVGGLTQFLHLAFGLWFAEIVIFAALAVMAWQALSLSPTRAMGITRFEPRSFGIGVAFGLVNYAAWAIPTMALAHAVFPKKVLELFDSAKIFDRQTPLEFWLIVIGVSVAAPLGEEFFFRGFMQRGLEKNSGGPRAIVVTAFIFSAFHLDPVGLVSRFELGLLFGLLAWYSGSIWPAIGAHAANNAISSTLFLLSRDSLDAKDDEIPWLAALIMFAVGNAVLYLLVRYASPGLKVAAPADFVDEKRPSPGTMFGPWVVGAVAAITLLIAVDRRGVALNVVDGIARSPDSVRKRPDVIELRARVRRGEAPLDEYKQLIGAK
ncbi:MAG: CPBP family intramembrane metalloprotease [Archangium sp.]|nr:CPBP family intramembrane metalloprotease [Archangium sp.]